MSATPVTATPAGRILKTLSALKTEVALKPASDDKTSPVQLKIDLRALREAAGVTLAIAAHHTDINYQTLTQAERGGNLGLFLALKIALFYEKTVDEIWEINPDYKGDKQ